MKGILFKKNDKWFVKYTKHHPAIMVQEYNAELPLYFEYDDLLLVQLLNVPVCDLNGKKIEFNFYEVWREVDGETEVTYYASLKKEHYIENVNEIKETKKEITEEEIKKQSWKYDPRKKMDIEFIRAAFVAGAKWMQEQLKNN